MFDIFQLSFCRRYEVCPGSSKKKTCVKRKVTAIVESDDEMTRVFEDNEYIESNDFVKITHIIGTSFLIKSLSLRRRKMS